MHLDFLRELLGDEFIIETDSYEGCEHMVIRCEDFDDAIDINYFPDSYYKYVCSFASWHTETSSGEEIGEIVLDIADRQLAVIEFFEDDVACFGGAIDMGIAEGISHDILKGMFEDGEQITGLTFSVRSWDSYCCYDGLFVKHAEEGHTIFRIYKGKADR